MPQARNVASLALLVPALAAGCGSDDGAAGPLTVVATTSIAADIAEHVAGRGAEVTQLIPDSISPHDFQASAQDRQTIAEADLLVEFGTGLEATVPDDNAPAVFRFTEHAGELREGSDAHEEGEGGEEGFDPHVWMDPTRIAAAAPALAEALAEADPEIAGEYASRARRYADRLNQLDSKIGEAAEAVPSVNRRLVTSHDALGYFADRYGLEVVATPFGLSPEAEASANDIEAVISAVEAENVPAVFVEQGDDPQVLERVADATGVEVVDDLLVEGFGPGTGAISYEEMVNLTAIRIFEALGSKAAYVLEFE